MTRLRVVSALAVLAVLVGCAPAPLPAPLPPYEARNLGVMVTGRIVLGSVQIRAVAGTSHVDSVGICVTGADFPSRDATLTQTWQTFSSTRRFDPGDYVARACVRDGGHDQQVAGVTASFTVR